MRTSDSGACRAFSHDTVEHRLGIESKPRVGAGERPGGPLFQQLIDVGEHIGKCSAVLT